MRTDSYSCSISKIETTDKHTIVSFEYIAPGEESWAQINKEIFIKTNLSDKHYKFVKAQNITIAPEKTTLEKPGEKLAFQVYFEKIPKNAKSIDVIENAQGNNTESSYFNYYKVSLTESQGNFTNSIRLSPPPPATYSGTVTSSPSSNMANVFSTMAPMFGTMAKSMMDAQLDYYKQPGKIEEIAKLNREYFNALVKEGFTEDQALKIITAESLLPKATNGK